MRRYLVLIFVTAVIAPPIVGPLRPVDLLALGLLPTLLGTFWTRRRTPALSTSERLFLLFVGWSAIATILGIVTGANGRGFWAALTMARLLELVAVYAAVRLHAPDRVVLGRAAALSGVALACWGVVEIVTGTIVHGEPYVRAFNDGWFRGESTHTAGAVVLLALASLTSIAGGRIDRAGWWGFAASLAAVVVSGSRAALAAGIMTALRALGLLGRRWSIIVLMAVVALAAIFAPATFRNRAFHVLDQGTYAGPHVDRFAAWRVAVAESPPWGVGLGARPSSVYESNYVWIYAETGLPGLALALLFLVSLVRRPERAVAEDTDVADVDEEAAWRLRSGIGLALIVLSLGANILLIARVAIPAAVLLAAFASQTGSGKSGDSLLHYAAAARREREME